MTVHSPADSFQSHWSFSNTESPMYPGRKINRGLQRAALWFQGDLSLSAGLRFLTLQPAGLLGMTRESSTNRAVRPLGLWGRHPPTPCSNGSSPGRGRAPVVANMVAWYRGGSSGLGKSCAVCVLEGEETSASK